MHPPRFPLIPALVAVALAVGGGWPLPQAGAAEARWWKGNLHTHSLWSDGDDYPEMIADWYKKTGYDFLAFSDHNIMLEGEKWLSLRQAVSFAGQVNVRGGGDVFRKYLERFGPDWVERHEIEGLTQVRLKPLEEFRVLFEEPGRFLLIPGVEVTHNRQKDADGRLFGATVHINVTNLRDMVKPANEDDAVKVMQTIVDAVHAQREATGRAMFPHINHPNFRWGITPEELMRINGLRFFEVYNGHPQVNNDGDENHASTDAMWDIVLTQRMTTLNLGVMYGIATDDSHNYHNIQTGRSNPGRGWVMVRSTHLTPEYIVRAMEAGDFYSSTGVVLDEVSRGGDTLSLTIAGEPNITYVTQFIGTRRNFDRRSSTLPPGEDDHRGRLPRRRYSSDIGTVFAEVEGTRASYTLQGDEIYVRAKIVSSKPKAHGGVEDEFEVAWTQPLVNAVPVVERPRPQLGPRR